jgi:hypothetical protein
MMEDVDEAGNTSLCASDGSGCGERSAKDVDKIKAQSTQDQEVALERLESMEANSMKEDLKEWLRFRKRVLKVLIGSHHTEL